MPHYSTPYILSPDIIVMGVFSISIIVACLNFNFWGDISGLTFCIILLSIIMFNLGSFFVKKDVIRPRPDNPKYLQLYIPNNISIVVIAFMVYVTYLDYQDTVKIAGEAGLPFFALIALARKNLYIEATAMDHSAWLYQGLYICKAFSLIYIYIIFYQKKIMGQKINLLYFVPVVLYIIQAFLSTGRTDFIHVIYAIIIIYYGMTKSKQRWLPKHEKNFFKYIYGGLIVFLGLFFFLASVRSEGEAEIAKSIRNYVGSSIMAYDWYLNHYGIYSTASYWGEQTQLFYYSVARAFGLTKMSGVSVLPECYISGEMTNIYTCLYRYTHDYGIFVMFVILFFVGFFYTKFFYRLQRTEEIGLSLIFYAYLSSPLVEFSIDERLFSTLLSARTLFVCIYIYLLFKIMIRRKSMKCYYNTV